MWWCPIVLLLLVQSPVPSKGQEGPQIPPPTCTGPAVASVIVTLILCIIFFACFVFVQRRKGSAPLKQDAEDNHVRAAYSNPSFEADETDNIGGERTSMPEGSVNASPKKNGENNIKGMSTLERVMAVVKTNSKSSLTRTLDNTGRKGVTGEESLVPLHATDFAGLGFSVSGTLRDGIYVKDLLNKGPAALSGKVEPGDRLVALTVVTEHCAQDDAINLLSYASPYPVLLHLIKGSAPKSSSSGLNLSNISSTSSPSKGVMKSGDQMVVPVHPSFRSQSSGDLSKITAGEQSVSMDMRMGGDIDGPHTRISDSAIDQLTNISRSKTQGRHSERAIDVPESALKPSSAYGYKLRPGSSQDVGHVKVDIEEEDKGVKKSSISSISKLGFKVLPDITLVKKSNDSDHDALNISMSAPVTSIDMGYEENTTLDTVRDKIDSHEENQINSKNESEFETVLDMIENREIKSGQEESDKLSIKSEESYDNTKLSEENPIPSIVNEIELSSNTTNESREMISNYVSDPIVSSTVAVQSIENTTTDDTVDSSGSIQEARADISSRPIPLERKTLISTSLSNMMTDDEALRASPITPEPEREPEAGTSSSSFLTTELRTDDEKQSAMRGYTFELGNRRNYITDATVIGESPECDEDKILMDSSSPVNIEDDAIRTVNRVTYNGDIQNNLTREDIQSENFSYVIPEKLEFDLSRNKTDQVKDEEFSAIIQRTIVTDENSDTEDDAAMKNIPQVPYRRDTEEIGESSMNEDDSPKRKVTSPNDRSNIFGMYINHEFQTDSQDKETLESDSLSNDEHTHSESFIAARNLFSNKSELKLITEVPKDKDGYTQKSNIVTSTHEVNIDNNSDNFSEASDSERKVSLLNYEITSPQKSTLEVQMSPASTADGNQSVNSLLESSEHDLPEALRKTSYSSLDEDSGQSLGFGTAFGFKGFKNRINRDAELSNDVESNDGKNSEAAKDRLEINSKVSSIKMSFENKYSDLPESEAFFTKISSQKLRQRQPSIESDNVKQSEPIGESQLPKEYRTFSMVDSDQRLPPDEMMPRREIDITSYIIEDDEKSISPVNEGDSIDSDEISMSRAAMAALNNRHTKNNRRNSSGNTESDKDLQSYKIEIGKMVTGCVDVDLPNYNSKVEVSERMESIEIDEDLDILPTSITGIETVKVLDSNNGELFHSSIEDSIIHDMKERKLIKVDSFKQPSLEIENRVHVTQQPMQQVQVTVNTRKSLTDSEELKRKASSLGDLSQIPDSQEESILERAVSLEFKPHAEGKNILQTHKISLTNASASSTDQINESVSISQNMRNDSSLSRRRNIWGNLEDSFHNRHDSSDDSIQGVNGQHSVSVQTNKRRETRASSLEGLHSSVGRSNSTKLMVNQPHVTVRSNPTLSLSTVDNNDSNPNAYSALRNTSYQTRTIQQGGPVSNIEISDDHGISITSLSHSQWLDENKSEPEKMNGNGSTTIRVLENYPMSDNKVLVVDTSNISPLGNQITSLDSVPRPLYPNEHESEVTVTTVSGSGKTSFITSSSPPDLLPIKKGQGGYLNGDIVRVNSDENLVDINLINSMTKITLDGNGTEFPQDSEILNARTLVIPSSGPSAAISIKQSERSPPALQPPY